MGAGRWFNQHRTLSDRGNRSSCLMLVSVSWIPVTLLLPPSFKVINFIKHAGCYPTHSQLQRCNVGMCWIMEINSNLMKTSNYSLAISCRTNGFAVTFGPAINRHYWKSSPCGCWFVPASSTCYYSHLAWWFAVAFFALTKPVLITRAPLWTWSSSETSLVHSHSLLLFGYYSSVAVSLPPCTRETKQGNNDLCGTIRRCFLKTNHMDSPGIRRLFLHATKCLVTPVSGRHHCLHMPWCIPSCTA